MLARCESLPCLPPGQVDYYMQYFLSDSSSLKTFPGILHIAVVGESTPENPLCRGLLKSTSPEEQRHALLLSIARDITSQKTSSELEKWRQLLLTTVVQFTRYSCEDDLFWACTNHRESIGAVYEVSYYSSAVGLAKIT